MMKTLTKLTQAIAVVAMIGGASLSAQAELKVGDTAPDATNADGPPVSPAPAVPSEDPIHSVAFRQQWAYRIWIRENHEMLTGLGY